MKQILTIWKKELKDTLRDRRTVLSAIVMPLVLMPLLIVGIAKLTEYQMKQLEEQTVKILFVHGADNPLGEYVRQQPKFEIVESTMDSDIKEAVKNGEINIAVESPADFEQRIARQENIEIPIYYDSTDNKSENAMTKFNLALASFNDTVIAQRFTSQNINRQILSKAAAKPADVATEQERGGFGLGFILPMFIVIWSIAGGQYTAIDVSAGEKERKTLESLLLTPASRLEIVFGKFLAVATTSVVSVIMSLASFYVAFAFGFSDLTGQGGDSGLSFTVGAGTIVLLFAVSLLLVLMFSAIQLSIGIFAKSFKEAQSYIGPAYLIVVLPIAILNTLPNFSPETWFYFIPIINALMLFKELLVGTYDAGHILATFASLAVFSAIAIYATVRVYSKEKVLFTD